MPRPDLTKMIEHTGYKAFMNRRVITGIGVITGSTVEGINLRTFNYTLANTPDLSDLTFNGASDTVWEGSYGDQDPRPDAGWFQSGSIWVRGDSGTLPNNPQPFEMYASMSGNILQITAMYSQQFSDTMTLTPAPFSFKFTDYSAF